MASTLGKRKERDDDVHGSTLFVSNLPYTATSVDLQTLFSDIAPVRSAFVVTEPGTGISKGVGYVSFALKEDAQTVFDTPKDGISLAGRCLRLQWADSKPKDKDKRVKRDPQPRPVPRVHTPHDPLAIRTIIVSGLPSPIDSKALWKKFRKYPGAEKVDWPIKSDDGEENPSTAYVLFSSPFDANAAIGKLHAHVFKGSLLSVTLKKRLDDSLPKPLAKIGKIAKAAGAPSHASRLIVRNIPFNATEQDLRAVFLPYGPVYSIHIPLAEEKKKSSETVGPIPPRTKGYAFVWMLSKKDAESAMEGCNGMTIRAGLAEGMVLDKQKKKKQRRLEMKMKEAGIAKDGEGEAPEETEKGPTERVIAVDWALSKDRWKEEKAKMGLDGTEDVEMDDASSGRSTDGSDGSEDGDESDGSDSHMGVHEGDDSDEENSGDEDGADDTESRTPIKPQLPPPEEGTTLFIRNVPFSATEDELRILFRTFGPLRYARITMEVATGRSRGTGFACFWNKEDADKVIEQSELLRLETTGSVAVSVAAKKNPFTMPSLLTADPSSTLAKSLVLHGRTLDVVRAVTRDIAGKLKEEGERRREKADKRNMYLLREGVILPNTPAADTLTSTEVERRTTSYNARRALLRSNPSLFISKTRLSVRQIPLFVTERVLKRLAIHAVRAFQDDVRNGARTELSPDELAEAQKDEEEETEPKKKMTKHMLLGRRTGVKQAKIVRQAERVDAVTGKARSKGYGFVEMHKHADALRVLRWANNNPDVTPLFEAWWNDELQDLIKAETANADSDGTRLKRLKEELEKGSSKKSKGTLIIDFSIENITTLQRRKEQVSVSTNKPEKSSPAKVEERPTKIISASQAQSNHQETPTKSVGALIGRKRKERKLGKKA